MSDRIIILEGIHNCRDLGGIVTITAGKIRNGFLYRSANLAEASEDDLSKLRHSYNVRKIVDLRTSRERYERPDKVAEGLVYEPLPLFDGPIPGISHEQENAIMKGELPFMDMLYRGLIKENSCRDNISRAVSVIMKEAVKGHGVIWHCTEGKDRCGLVSAVLLAVLDVSREEIMKDYLMTNLVNGPKAELYYRQAIANGAPEAHAAGIRDLFLAKESYLCAAFEEADALYPDREAFLTEGLGLSRQLLEAFREMMLE